MYILCSTSPNFRHRGLLEPESTPQNENESRKFFLTVVRDSFTTCESPFRDRAVPMETDEPRESRWDRFPDAGGRGTNGAELEND
jgi:hypothetical protein